MERPQSNPTHSSAGAAGVGNLSLLGGAAASGGVHHHAAPGAPPGGGAAVGAPAQGKPPVAKLTRPPLARVAKYGIPAASPTSVNVETPPPGSSSTREKSNGSGTTKPQGTRSPPPPPLTPTPSIASLTPSSAGGGASRLGHVTSITSYATTTGGSSIVGFSSSGATGKGSHSAGGGGPSKDPLAPPLDLGMSGSAMYQQRYLFITGGCVGSGSCGGNSTSGAATGPSSAAKGGLAGGGPGAMKPVPLSNIWCYDSWKKVWLHVFFEGPSSQPSSPAGAAQQGAAQAAAAPAQGLGGPRAVLVNAKLPISMLGHACFISGNTLWLIGGATESGLIQSLLALTIAIRKGKATPTSTPLAGAGSKIPPPPGATASNAPPPAAAAAVSTPIEYAVITGFNSCGLKHGSLLPATCLTNLPGTHAPYLFVMGGLTQCPTAPNAMAYTNRAFALDLDETRFRSIVQRGDVPSPRAASAVCLLSEDPHRILLYGGRNEHKVLDDLYVGTLSSDFFHAQVALSIHWVRIPRRSQAEVWPGPRAGHCLTHWNGFALLTGGAGLSQTIIQAQKAKGFTNVRDNPANKMYLLSVTATEAGNDRDSGSGGTGRSQQLLAGGGGGSRGGRGGSGQLSHPPSGVNGPNGNGNGAGALTPIGIQCAWSELPGGAARNFHQLFPLLTDWEKSSILQSGGSVGDSTGAASSDKEKGKAPGSPTEVPASPAPSSSSAAPPSSARSTGTNNSVVAKSNGIEDNFLFVGGGTTCCIRHAGIDLASRIVPMPPSELINFLVRFPPELSAENRQALKAEMLKGQVPKAGGTLAEGSDVSPSRNTSSSAANPTGSTSSSAQLDSPTNSSAGTGNANSSPIGPLMIEISLPKAELTVDSLREKVYELMKTHFSSLIERKVRKLIQLAMRDHPTPFSHHHPGGQLDAKTQADLKQQAEKEAKEDVMLEYEVSFSGRNERRPLHMNFILEEAIREISSAMGHTINVHASLDNPPYDYALTKRLGKGTYGEVFMALNEVDSSLFAVKVVPISDEKALDGLRREIRMMRQLRHPNIVQYLGSRRVGDSMHIFMDFIAGGDTLEKFCRSFTMPIRQVQMYVRQLLHALEFLHRYKIVHRDVKGANVLLSVEGIVKLTDFGTAKHLNPNSLTKTTSVAGTMLYMAPEVMRSEECTEAADIWSVGCLVVELVTGDYPFAEKQFKDVMQVAFWVGSQNNHPLLPGRLPESGVQFLKKCFQPIPSLRPTAAQLLQDPFVTQLEGEGCVASSVSSSFGATSHVDPMHHHLGGPRVPPAASAILSQQYHVVGGSSTSTTALFNNTSSTQQQGDGFTPPASLQAPSRDLSAGLSSEAARKDGGQVRRGVGNAPQAGTAAPGGGNAGVGVGLPTRSKATANRVHRPAPHLPTNSVATSSSGTGSSGASNPPNAA